MRASVHVDLPGWTKEGLDALKARCEELSVQPRGTRGESGGQTGTLYISITMNLIVCSFYSLDLRKTINDSLILLGHTYDISNKHRLGHSEVGLVQTMIDGVNTLWKEDLELCKKHGI